MHISTIIHVHVSHTPCLSAATAPGGDLSKMLLPDKTGGETTMVNGEYDCAPMLATGTKGQNIGPNRHPLRDFENVPHTPLQLTPDSILIESNATHIWRLYYWSYWNQTEPPEVHEHGMGNLWLGNNLGMISLSFEPIGTSVENAPRPPQCMIDMMSNKVGRKTGTKVPNQVSDYYVLGFDGFPYPMPNDRGMGWPQPKPTYISKDSPRYPRTPTRESFAKGGPSSAGESASKNQGLLALSLLVSLFIHLI